MKHRGKPEVFQRNRVPGDVAHRHAHIAAPPEAVSAKARQARDAEGKVEFVVGGETAPLALAEYRLREAGRLRGVKDLPPFRISQSAVDPQPGRRAHGEMQI